MLHIYKCGILILYTVPTFNSCTKRNLGIKHDHMPDYRPVFWAWMPPQMNVALICKLYRVIGMLDLLFDMLSMGVCTNRNWQTSGQLVQELNLCTVYILNAGIDSNISMLVASLSYLLIKTHSHLEYTHFQTYLATS